MVDEKRKHILDCEDAVKVIKKFNVKRLVVGRGHDCGGLLADLCIGSKVVAEYSDDGWGGEAEIRFTSDADEAKVKAILDKGNFAKLLFEEGGWAFMKSVDRIDFQSQIDSLVSALAELKGREKAIRACKNKLLFGRDHNNYSWVSWKGVKNLSELETSNLQRTYDKYKKDLKKWEKFLNTDEQLLSLGIKL
jgi:hypothetical protein